MKIELTLARLEAKARDLIDLAGLARAIGAIGELTEEPRPSGDCGKKVTDTLKRAAEAIRPDVRRVVGGLATMVAWVRRQARHSVTGGRTPRPRRAPSTSCRRRLGSCCRRRSRSRCRPRSFTRFRRGPGNDRRSGRQLSDGLAGRRKETMTSARSTKSRSRAPSWLAFRRHARRICSIYRDTKYKIERRAKRSWRDPGFKQEDDHPVVFVNWHDAQAYVAWLGSDPAARPTGCCPKPNGSIAAVPGRHRHIARATPSRPRRRTSAEI